MPFTEYASFSHQTRTLKTNILWFHIKLFYKYYFKTATICLFLSSHVFTASEFDSNYFGILLWKIVKPRDHNEITLYHQSEKYSENKNQSDIIL